ncbi:protoporphyrinogen oxidase [Mycetocola reblochoni]|nr:protoporphyrinogen oxidase [Mycetocola reblochoni]
MTLQHAVVVGAGVAGLVAARELLSAGITVTVVEAADRAGGQLRAEEVGGVTVDVGAESYATRGGAVDALVEELGLGDARRDPNPAGAWLRLPVPGGEGSAVPIPAGGILGIPANPFAEDVRRAIGWSGAWRAYLDRVMPVLAIGKVHNLGALVSRRMGARVRDRLVAPVTGGVYSAAPEDLDVVVAAPGLNSALTRNGSLSGAVAELRAQRKPGGAVHGLDGGMTTLVDALVDGIVAAGGEILVGRRATSLRGAADSAALLSEAVEQGSPVPEDVPVDGWLVGLDDGELLGADVVLLACAEAQTSALLADAGHPDAVPERTGPAARVDVVTLVLDSAALDAHPRGTGLLVSDGAPVGAKALTHSNAKWAWLDERLPEHRHVVRLSYGRQGDVDRPVAGDDQARTARALADASDLLGVRLDAGDLVDARWVAWWNTQPVAALGEAERRVAVRRAIEAVPGIEVAGAWIGGTGIASVVPDATAAAKRLRHVVYERYLERDAH